MCITQIKTVIYRNINSNKPFRHPDKKNKIVGSQRKYIIITTHENMII